MTDKEVIQVLQRLLDERSVAIDARDATIAELENELWAINEVMGFRRDIGIRIDVETAAGRARQLERGLDLMNSCAAIFQPPEDLGPNQFVPWCKEQAQKIENDRTTIAELRKALEPFSAHADLYDDPPLTGGVSDIVKLGYGVGLMGQENAIVTVGDFRRARAALKASEPK